MSAVPITFHGTMYPKDKSVKPYAFTAVGMANITGLEVGGGPILPPDEVPPVEPPLTIWPPGPGIDLPAHPIVIPPPPVDPPTAPQPPHEGWNWKPSTPSNPSAGWYYLWIPEPGDAQPKR